MIQVSLHGKLSKYGPDLDLEINRPSEVIRAIGFQLPLFFEDLQEGSYAVLKDGRAIDLEEMSFTIGNCRKIDIIPIIEGEGGSGFGKIIVGIALIALSVVTAGAAAPVGAIMINGVLVPTFGAAAGIAGGFAAVGISAANLAAIGGLMAISGAARLLSPTPEVADISNRENPSDVPSALISSQVNTQSQGQPVPLGYGLVMVGGVIVMASLTTEQTPIEELIDEQTDFESFHEFFTEPKNLTSVNKVVVGFLRNVAADGEDLLVDWPLGEGQNSFGMGQLRPSILRNANIRGIFEVRDVATSIHKMVVLMATHTPFDQFQGITITSVDDLTLFFAGSISNSVFGEEVRDVYLGGRHAPVVVDLTFIEWIWDLGVQSSFLLPVSSGPTDVVKVKFSYNE